MTTSNRRSYKTWRKVLFTLYICVQMWASWPSFWQCYCWQHWRKYGTKTKQTFMVYSGHSVFRYFLPKRKLVQVKTSNRVCNDDTKLPLLSSKAFFLSENELFSIAMEILSLQNFKLHTVLWETRIRGFFISVILTPKSQMVNAAWIGWYLRLCGFRYGLGNITKRCSSPYTWKYFFLGDIVENSK